jgi:repressor LexA
MQALTARQSEVLALIRDHLNRYGMPPTRAEIADELGFRSPNAADDHLKALARKGAISLTPGASRGVRVLDNWVTAHHLAVVGRVAAGNPVFCEQHIEDHVQIDAAVFKPKADYLLRVTGDSMRDAGILDKDLLAVRMTRDVTNGQIVVARINDEVTVKRFKRRGRQVELRPENPDYPVITVDLSSNEFEIEGVGVGVLRKDIHGT